MNNAWEALDETEQDALWKKIRTHFAFDPMLDGAKSVFQPAGPNSTIDLLVFDDQSDIEDLNSRILSALCACTEESERVYLLDPYHLQGWFAPHHPRARTALLEYQSGFYSNDEYKLCLSEDFRFGFLVNGLKRTVTAFGSDLLSALHKLSLI